MMRRFLLITLFVICPPMMIGLHGYTGTGKGFENETIKIFEHINRNGYIGVFPDGDNFAWDVVWDFFQKHQRTKIK